MTPTMTPTKLEVTRADGSKMILRHGFTRPTRDRGAVLAAMARVVRKWEREIR